MFVFGGGNEEPEMRESSKEDKENELSGIEQETGHNSENKPETRTNNNKENEDQLEKMYNTSVHDRDFLSLSTVLIISLRLTLPPSLKASNLTNLSSTRRRQGLKKSQI